MILTSKLTALSAGLLLAGLSTAPIVSHTYTVHANGTTQSVALLQQGSTVYVPLKDAAQWANAKAQVNLKTHQIIWTTAHQSSSPKSPTTAGVPLSTWPKALILANYTPKWTAITPKHPLVLNNGTTVTHGLDSGIMYAFAGDMDKNSSNPRVLTQYATYVLNGKYQRLSFSAGIPNAVKNNDGTVTISIAIGSTVQRKIVPCNRFQQSNVECIPS
jgi:hypothetical protein